MLSVAWHLKPWLVHETCTRQTRAIESAVLIARAPSPQPVGSRSPQQQWNLSPTLAGFSPAIREDIMALHDSVAPGVTARPELQQAAEWYVQP
jgi:hypothetical protein